MTPHLGFAQRLNKCLKSSLTPSCCPCYTFAVQNEAPVPRLGRATYASGTFRAVTEVNPSSTSYTRSA
mgnify:CR=1 FL=1